MNRMCSRARAATAAAAGLALIAGCGGQPTVVPAGSAGLEVPTEEVSSDGKDPAPTKKKPAPEVSATAQAPAPTKTTAAEPSKKDPDKAKPQAGAPEPPASATAAAAPQGLALPEPGAYSYAVKGSSSLGPPPATSTLTVADVGQGAQLWTVDTRRKDGAGLIEELTLSRSANGVLLSAYRLDASTGIAGVILEFAPTKPVLLTPVGGKAGRTWAFDLGTSKDGCSSATGKGELIDPGDPASAKSVRHFRLTTTVSTNGPASCIDVAGVRVQDVHHTAASMLPTRLDSDLQGSVAAVAFQARTSSTRVEDGSVQAARESTLDAVSYR